MRRTLLLAAAGLTGAALLLRGAPAWAAPQVQQPAPDFSAMDSNGATHSLAALRGKIVVLEWTNHECPYVRKHYGANNMQNLQREVTGAGAVWLTVISSAQGAQGHVLPDAGQQSDQDPQRGADRRAARSQGYDGPRLFCADDAPHVCHQPAGHAGLHGRHRFPSLRPARRICSRRYLICTTPSARSWTASPCTTPSPGPTAAASSTPPERYGRQALLWEDGITRP